LPCLRRRPDPVLRCRLVVPCGTLTEPQVSIDPGCHWERAPSRIHLPELLHAEAALAVMPSGSRK
jgi:hypothetical protein